MRDHDAAEPLRYGRPLTQHGSYALLTGPARTGEHKERRSLSAVAEQGAVVKALWRSTTSLLDSNVLSRFEFGFGRELEDASMTREEFDARMTSQAAEETVQIRLNAKQLSAHERLVLGAYYLDDAVARRHTCRRVRWNVPSAVALYRIHRHRSWFFVMSIVALMLCALAIAEPGETWKTAVNGQSLLAEGVLLLVILADIAMPALYMGWRSTLVGVGPFRVCFSALMVLDLCIAGGRLAAGAPSFRFTRVLRPGFILFTQRAPRNTVYALLSTLPALWDVALLLLVSISAFALAATALYGNSTEAWPAAEDGSFGDTYATFWSSWLTLFVLTTQDNFPSAMLISLDSKATLVLGTPAGATTSFGDELGQAADWLGTSLFFGAFMVVTTFMILSVAVAVIFENYKLHHRKVVVEGKRCVPPLPVRPLGPRCLALPLLCSFLTARSLAPAAACAQPGAPRAARMLRHGRLRQLGPPVARRVLQADQALSRRDEHA